MPSTATDREAAWLAVHDALARLPGWRSTKAELYDDDRRWHATAVDARPRGRLARHEAISATRSTEADLPGGWQRPERR